MKTVKITKCKYDLKYDYYVNDNGSVYSAISNKTLSYQLDKDGYPHDSVQVNREGNNQNEEEIKNLPNNEEIEVGSGENQKEETSISPW